jgi:hypothetical protein
MNADSYCFEYKRRKNGVLLKLKWYENNWRTKTTNSGLLW